MRKPNKSRGEVAVTVAGEKLILCATMENLDQLEQVTGGLGLVELMRQIGGCHGSTLKAGLVSLSIEGDPEKAWNGQVGAAEFPKIQEAVQSAIVPDLGGNAEAEVESRS
ncbi:hypothetical protein FIV00_15085 [Labrenzia sp. THAF82]|uniref:hypothetical protein n=1 Tax=Labrenzia sp. THAF82 TaxID=2587861 RepID=UPI001268C0EE|nr:hypothetical protein [Labrenzia sp. THAF82]QFT31815.1 hypothetical protein FIV00_15085 [Labrenzia sp. THAF82]